MTILWPPFVGWMFFCSLLFRILSRTRVYKEKDKIGHTPDTLDSAPTIRELDVLKAIAKGMSTHEISECLFISENTVEWHRKNLMVKFGAKNATDLVIKALSKGYLSIPLK